MRDGRHSGMGTVRCSERTGRPRAWHGGTSEWSSDWWNRFDRIDMSSFSLPGGASERA
jgi:hypothetical protein